MGSSFLLFKFIKYCKLKAVVLKLKSYCRVEFTERIHQNTAVIMKTKGFMRILSFILALLLVSFMGVPILGADENESNVSVASDGTITATSDDGVQYVVSVSYTHLTLPTMAVV